MPPHRTASIELGRRVARILRGTPETDPDDRLITALDEGGVLGVAAERSPELVRRAPPAGDILTKQVLDAAIQARKVTQVMEYLRRWGIDPILLKGLATARHYSTPGIRPTGDIDLLVGEAELDDACERLQEFGYDVSVPITTYGAGRVATAYPRGAAPGFYTDAGIDVQTHLWPLAVAETAAALGSSYRVAIGEMDVRVLPPTTEIRFLAVHAAKHAFLRPLWLCDLATAVTASGDLDWEAVFSGSLRIKTWIRTSVGLTADLLGLEIPEPAASVAATSQWLHASVLARWSGMRETDRRSEVRDALLVRHSALDVLRIGREIWPDGLGAMAALGWPFLRPLAGPATIALALYRATRFFTDSPVARS